MDNSTKKTLQQLGKTKQVNSSCSEKEESPQKLMPLVDGIPVDEYFKQKGITNAVSRKNYNTETLSSSGAKVITQHEEMIISEKICADSFEF